MRNKKTIFIFCFFCVGTTALYSEPWLGQKVFGYSVPEGNIIGINLTELNLPVVGNVVGGDFIEISVTKNGALLRRQQVKPVANAAEARERLGGLAPKIAAAGIVMEDLWQRAEAVKPLIESLTLRSHAAYLWGLLLGTAVFDKALEGDSVEYNVSVSVNQKVVATQKFSLRHQKPTPKESNLSLSSKKSEENTALVWAPLAGNNEVIAYHVEVSENTKGTDSTNASIANKAIRLTKNAIEAPDSSPLEFMLPPKYSGSQYSFSVTAIDSWGQQQAVGKISPFDQPLEFAEINSFSARLAKVDRYEHAGLVHALFQFKGLFSSLELKVLNRDDQKVATQSYSFAALHSMKFVENFFKDKENKEKQKDKENKNSPQNSSSKDFFAETLVKMPGSYMVWVDALSSKGKVLASSSQVSVMVADQRLPPSVGSFKVEASAQGNVLQWSYTSKWPAGGFAILRGERGQKGFATVATVAANLSKYLDSKVVYDRSYIYQVRAIDVSGEYGEVSQSKFVKTQKPPDVITAPLLAAAWNDVDSVCLNWRVNSGLKNSHYVIFKGSSSKSQSQIAKVETKLGTYCDKNDAYGKKFFYALAVLHNSGKSSERSVANEIQIPYPRPAMPQMSLTSSGPESGEKGFASLKWNSSYKYIKNYILYIRGENETGWRVLATEGKKTSRKVSGLDKGKTYYFSLAVENLDGVLSPQTLPLEVVVK